MLVKDPVYLQLSNALRDCIRHDEFQVGTRFLTEREISCRFGVSRTTANKALSSLVAEGILEFKKGVGTFVRGATLEYDLRALVSFTDKARAAGKVPSTRVLEVRDKSAREIDAAVRESLRIGTNDSVYELVRLRLADGAPVILEYRLVVARHCPGLDAMDLARSLYGVWTDHFKLAIAGADETIRAVVLGPSEAAMLEAAPGSAALEIMAIGSLLGGEPLWWERTLYRGDAYEVHNRLGPIEQARPAAGVLRSVTGDATAQGSAEPSTASARRRHSTIN